MNIYFSREHYNPEYRGYVFPLLKPFLKSKDFTVAQRKAMYGVSENNFKIVTDIDNSDVCILTMSWNYYVINKKLDQAIEFIEFSRKHHKKVWIVNVLDSPLKLPNFKNCILFEPGVYASKLKSFQNVIPVFIQDPLKLYYKTDSFIARPYNSIPTVGFCGLADGSILNKYERLLKILLRNFASYLGLRHLKTETLIEPAYLRHRVMALIENSKVINSNFIIRSHYSAGKQKKNDKVQSHTLEFYDNIRDSDYVLCIRGAGNFSVRFYETLAMGRIPIFINTDSVLPLSHVIPWKHHVVWVEYDELHLIEEKIVRFHQQLNERTLNDLFKRNRKLWDSKLCLSDYFKLTYHG